MAKLTEDVTVGATPGSTNGEIPASPGTAFTVTADPSLEYAAGGALGWYVNLPRALPWSLDDLTRDFGSDVYERMLLDPQVKSVLNVLKASILETGLTFSPAVEDKDDPDYKLAAQLQEEAERMVDDLETDSSAVCWDMLDALPLGNKLAEQRFDLATSATTHKQHFSLVSLTVKPRENVAFVVDAYYNLIGILGRVPGQPFGVQQGLLLADIQHVTNLLPRSKFAILSFRPKDNDPRGTSLLRSAFAPWNEKQQLRRERLKYLTQFASPSLIGYTPPEADPYQMTNSDGTLKVDRFDNPVMGSPQADMMATLQKFHNGSVSVFPAGAAVEEIKMSGDGQAFNAAFDDLNREIAKAILLQTLATEESQHQTRASTGIHKDTLDTVVRQIKRSVERMWRRDVLQTWVRLNKGEDAVHLAPVVRLGVTEAEDRAVMWTAVAALWNSGYLDKSQKPELDSDLGLPERDPDSLLEEELPPPSGVPLPGAPGPPAAIPGAPPAKGQPRSKAPSGHTEGPHAALARNPGKPLATAREEARMARRGKRKPIPPPVTVFPKPTRPVPPQQDMDAAEAELTRGLDRVFTDIWQAK